MKPIEELGIVVGIFAGIWTLAQAFGKSAGNTCGAPASAPSGTVQTTPFAGTAPSIPVPTLTNPFTTAFPTFQPVQPQAPQSPTTFHTGSMISCLPASCKIMALNKSLGPKGGGLNGGGHYFACKDAIGGIGYVCYN